MGLPLAARREATGLLRTCSGVEGESTVCMVNSKQKAAQFCHLTGAERALPPKHLVTRSGVTAQL